MLHLADHDPNGIDMTRDNTERLALYARQDVEVRRIAFNIDQVRTYNPPPNFAKEADSRYEAYVARFGEECWELDALSPTVIADLIRTETEAMIDAAAWRRREAAETRNRALLGRVSEGQKGRSAVSCMWQMDTSEALFFLLIIALLVSLALCCG